MIGETSVYKKRALCHTKGSALFLCEKGKACSYIKENQYFLDFSLKGLVKIYNSSPENRRNKTIRFRNFRNILRHLKETGNSLFNCLPLPLFSKLNFSFSPDPDPKSVLNIFLYKTVSLLPLLQGYPLQ